MTYWHIEMDEGTPNGRVPHEDLIIPQMVGKFLLFTEPEC
jgi:hypothetical protein